ncbi:MAG: tRNA modification GTPase MnmE [Alphaproteobacteria bacterium]|nr:MAG: tRNA modification GTPase MnmE [Alphaproteobacteria bacterium]
MDTIFALSSGAPPCAVAVIRLSGPGSRFAVETICGKLPAARRMVVCALRNPADGGLIDRAVCAWLPGPATFTGEDCAEFHVHGGAAVVRVVLAVLAALPGLRLAQPGEFTRRAFENGRLDLTEVEGLADLIAAQTEAQRRQAVGQAGGALRGRMEEWRERIVRLRALVEADLDFADEDDIPDSVAAAVWPRAAELAAAIRAALDDGRRGEIIRDGLRVVIMGPPNAGKSSLLNALAGREMAIVTDEPGTTRDFIEVHLDIDGYSVTVVDTAGIREASGKVEELGIRRAREQAEFADLVVWLTPGGEGDDAAQGGSRPLLVLRSKDDAGAFGEQGVSVMRPGGLDGLLSAIRRLAADRLGRGEAALVTRLRHRERLEECAAALERAAGEEVALEVRAEHLRRAGDAIGAVTGRLGVDEVLDAIFAEFCIGK